MIVHRLYNDCIGKMKPPIGLILLLISFAVQAQLPPVGGWRDHLSWNTAEAVAMTDQKIYCSNGIGLCIYNIQNRDISKLSKVNGLNDAGITALQSFSNSVIIGYNNGNIDILQDDQIYNISDIKINQIYTTKNINHIYISGNTAYLSCAFGIVVLDLAQRQIRDTYIIGNNGISVEVFGMTQFGGSFYAATAQGIKRANAQSNTLIDFGAWSLVNNIPNANGTFKQIVATQNSIWVCDAQNNIYSSNGANWITVPYTDGNNINRLRTDGTRLLVSTSGALLIYDATNSLQQRIDSYNGVSVMAFDAISGAEGSYWIADNRQGLVQWKSSSTVSFHLLNGPSSNYTAALRFKSDRLLAVSGGKNDAWQPLNRPGEVHILYSNQWSNITSTGAYDFTDADISSENPNIIYASSWGEGVYVFENGTIKNHYTDLNSSLVADFSGKILCSGLLMDKDNKLWVSNDKRASVLTSGQWQILSWQSNFSMGRFTEDAFKQIWTPLNNAGIWVFGKDASEQGKDGSTIRLVPRVTFPSGDVSIYKINGITNALDNTVWIASDKGPVLYDNPSQILEGIGVNGKLAYHTGTVESDKIFSLLGSETILSIAMDGAGRKWIATKSSGVFLISEDATQQVTQFTTENSPLFSNKVHDIAVSDRTGEIFFATDYGIVSYRGDAVSSGDDFGNVYVFPNPIRSDYFGEITITGLIKDADVKITDISGNLVYQTRTLGGQAVWNGCNANGRRVSTGVYLVFCSNDDGSKTHVTKLLFIK